MVLRYGTTSAFSALTGTVRSPVSHEERRKRPKLTRGQKRKLKAKKERKKRKKIVPVKYKEYIKSQAWRKRRNEYYKKNKKECVVCKSAYRIGLHHLSYERLGAERDEDLVALCWLHHAHYHEIHGVQRQSKDTTIQYIIDEQECEEFREIAKNL